MIKLALIGAGQRGNIYTDYAFSNKRAEITAIVEPHTERRNMAKQRYNVPAESAFASEADFFQKGKLADAVILASMDQSHFETTLKALDMGYDILLEKPISPDPVECLKIQQKANALKRTVIVCHVLRYTAFFSKIKEIIGSGQLGKIISIQHNENIGNFHFAHSFVRGNWSNAKQSSPLVMQKSCHDMDILTWLVGSDLAKISSFGDLTYFKEENAPKNSGSRCAACGAARDCRFNAVRCYTKTLGVWPSTVVCATQTEEALKAALSENDYGVCVYKSDNTVCDHQVAIMEFENGVTATFNLCAFTNKITRTIKIMFEHGELEGDTLLNRIDVTRFIANDLEEYETKTIYPETVHGGHGGGDTGLMIDFLDILEGKVKKDSLSSINKSIESHLMAFAAEQSRVLGKIICMKKLKAELAVRV